MESGHRKQELKSSVTSLSEASASAAGSEDDDVTRRGNRRFVPDDKKTSVLESTLVCWW